jgi:formate C-acetyltransferase
MADRKAADKNMRNIQRGMTPDDRERSIYGEDVRLGIVRSRLITESYKMTEGEPAVLRRAKALEHILRHMPVYIEDQQLIVGNYAESANHLVHFIEQNWRSVQRVIQPGAPGETLTDEAGRKEFDELCEYWDGRSLREILSENMNEEMARYFKYEGTILWSLLSEGHVPNYEKIFEIGLKGIIKQAEERLEEITELVPYDYFEQKDFLNAAIITLNAAVDFSRRFSKKAWELAVSETDKNRKKQLLEIAETCDWTPANPPRTLREAIQCFWMIHVIMHQIEFITIGIGARMDVIFNPFYVKDLEAGRITREKALELLKDLWINFEGCSQMYSPMISGVYGGGHLLQSLVIGGVDAEGKDVTNEMSYLILETAAAVKTLQGSICLRYHDGTPKELMMKAIDVIKTGIGYPALFNDKSMIPRIESWGFSKEEARNYVIFGCVYIHLPGLNAMHQGGGYTVVPKCLWWALHQGKDPKTGKQHGAPTPDPETFTSIDDVMDAYAEQVEFFAKKRAQLDNLGKAIYRKHVPRPFSSALLDGCIERGRDGRDWSPEAVFDHSVIVGPTNVVDSMVAMKKFVFDEKKVTIKELIEAIDNNWKGREELRLMMKNQAPKYGNDNDDVDAIAKEIHERTEIAIEESLNPFGISYKGDGSGVSATYGLAGDCEATPDGRKAGEPFADGTISPMPGADQNGPTAVLGSAATVATPYNQLLNQKFLPHFLEGEYKELFYSYLKTWGDMGISHIQFNIVDKDTLLDAQIHPENHTDLIVRVAGYSAYFVDLSKGLQDSIIARTEQEIG